MKKIKIFLMVAAAFLLTGCSAEYKATIDSKFRVTENINFIDKVPLDYDRDLFLKDVTERFYSSEYAGYTPSSKYVNDDEYSITLASKYSGLKSLSNSKFVKFLFDGAEIEEVGGNIRFTANNSEPYAKILEIIAYDPDLDIDDIVVKLKFHNGIVDHNADEFDSVNNELTWYINDDSIKRNLFFEVSNNPRYDIIIKDFITNNILVISFLVIVLLTATFITLHVLSRYVIKDKI